MKVLLLSFYDLGKQPKIISEVFNKLNSNSTEIDFIDYSLESMEVQLDSYDAIGIYASMHTATVLATQYLSNKNVPDKIFTFGLYGRVLSDSDSRIKYIENIEHDELDEYLNLITNDDYSLKFYVNQQKVDDLRMYIVEEGDRILISYGNEDAETIDKQLAELNAQTIKRL